jgi:hypothetical protein
MKKGDRKKKMKEVEQKEVKQKEQPKPFPWSPPFLIASLDFSPISCVLL